MSILRTCLGVASALAAMLAISTAQAAPITKNFGVLDANEPTFPTVMGDFVVIFSGEDTNNDDAIDRTEVTAFQGRYFQLPGNSVDSMSFSLASLNQFFYEVQETSPVFLTFSVSQAGTQNPLAVDSFFVTSTLMRAEDEDGDFASTSNFVIVEASPIPLPAGGLLLLSALGGAGLITRLRKSRAA